MFVADRAARGARRACSADESGTRGSSQCMAWNEVTGLEC